MCLGFYKKVIIINTFPTLVVCIDMMVESRWILEIHVTGRAMIVFTRTEMDFTHVSPHTPQVLHTFSTNHADKATVARLNLPCHQIIHSKGL